MLRKKKINNPIQFNSIQLMFYLSKLLIYDASLCFFFSLFLGDSSRNYVEDEKAEIKDVQELVHVCMCIQVQVFFQGT